MVRPKEGIHLKQKPLPIESGIIYESAGAKVDLHLQPKRPSANWMNVPDLPRKVSSS